MILTDLQKVQLTVQFQDAAGNAARVDGAPTWQSSDPSIIGIESVSDDGLSCFAVAAGPLGQAQVSVSGDADLGAGTRAVTGVMDFEVQASEAVSAAIAAGAPVDK